MTVVGLLVSIRVPAPRIVLIAQMASAKANPNSPPFECLPIAYPSLARRV